MRATLLLLTQALLAGLATAQCNCGCSYPVRSPVYSLPPPTTYPLCQPPPQQQSVMPPCYHHLQSPQIVVPLPPTPKDFRAAKTTIQQHPMMPQLGHFPGFHPGHSHPPICVQSVYVGKKEDEDDEGCKKKSKRKSGGDRDDEVRRPRRSRRQRRRYMDPTILRTLLAQTDDQDDPSDPDSPSGCDNCPCNSSPRIVYIDNQ